MFLAFYLRRGQVVLCSGNVSHFLWVQNERSCIGGRSSSPRSNLQSIALSHAASAAADLISSILSFLPISIPFPFRRGNSAKAETTKTIRQQTDVFAFLDRV